MLLLILWAGCVISAWIGIGRATLALVKAEETSWPFSGVVGAAVIVLLGGWMNLAGIIHPPELALLVVVGDLLFLRWTIQRRAKVVQLHSIFQNLSAWAWLLALGATLLVVVVSVKSLTFAKFSTFDDLSAYLTFPVKLFQLGSLPFDPFSERRVESGLGGNYFLQAFMLMVGDIRSLWFIDAGAGLMLFVSCMYRAARRLGNSRDLSVLLAALVVAIPLSHVNLGYTVLPAAIFVSMFLATTSEKMSKARTSLLLGILGAAVALLKSTYLPAALLITIGIPLLRVKRKRWLAGFSEVLLAILAFGFGLLPWMLDMHHKEGTMLYPLLGKGYEISAYGPVPHWIKPGYYPLVIGLIIMIAFGGAAWIHWISCRKCPQVAKISLFLLVGGIVALPISVSVAGSSLMRYVGPFELPFCLLFLASLLRVPYMDTPRIWVLRFSYVYACVLLFAMETYTITHSGFDIYFGTSHAEQNAAEAGTIILNTCEMRSARERATSLQSAIPAGQAVYADFMITFPMNFRRNEVYVADFPGMASLPPGMPTRDSPGALRSYLLARSIRFVAYSSRLVALRENGLAWPRRRSGTWPLVQSLNSADVDREIEVLAATYLVIYDDGDNRLIDLLQIPPSDLSQRKH